MRQSIYLAHLFNPLFGLNKLQIREFKSLTELYRQMDWMRRMSTECGYQTFKFRVEVIKAGTTW